ncbi:MAG: type II toxin-antitoxin system Phd/YefM family antitoxin, partial [SAR324 cluster bacterium]|nr:type II toxin-antitoxin system Phd/YefM family antitoxin [SAR324 cluster bacterium]
TVNEFRSSLKQSVEMAIHDHEVIRVTRKNAPSFVVISNEDWEREQETLRILENKSLMNQITTSLQTHITHTGYQPTREQMDEISGI